MYFHKVKKMTVAHSQDNNNLINEDNKNFIAILNEFNKH